MKLIIKKDIDTLSIALADWVVKLIKDTLKTKETFNLCLSGGSTPKKLYQLLASEQFKNQIDWSSVHFFWGDERDVPFNDEKNNAKMAFQSLLDYIPVKKKNIHFINTKLSPEKAARDYEVLLKKEFATSKNTFDLVLLGLGDNAHTLSLFPGYSIVHEQKKWVDSFYLSEQQMFRISLTSPVVNLSTNIVFLVSGADKADAVKHIIEDKFNPDLYPAQVIKPTNGFLFWWLDELASKKLSKKLMTSQLYILKFRH